MKRLMLLLIAVGLTSCAYDVQTEYYTPRQTYYTPRPTYNYCAPRPTYNYYTPRPSYHYCAPPPARYSPTWGSVDRWHFSYRGTTR